MSDDLKQRVQQLGSRLTGPARPAIGDIRRRAARRAYSRYAVQVGTGVAVLALLAVALSALLPLGGSGTPRPGSSIEPRQLASVATLICDDQGSHLDASTVEPQSDGVHFTVVNETAGLLTFDIMGGGTDNAPVGTTDFPPQQIAPGDWQVRCFDATSDAPTPEPYSTLTVSDPEGIWKSSELLCPDRVALADVLQDSRKGLQGDPVDLAAQEFSILAQEVGEEFPLQGDVTERAGYPDSPVVLVRTTRQESVIATARLEPDGLGGWVISRASYCKGGS